MSDDLPDDPEAAVLCHSLDADANACPVCGAYGECVGDDVKDARQYAGPGSVAIHAARHKDWKGAVA